MRNEEQVTPKEFLERILNCDKPIIILPHEQADIDAYATAWLFRDFLKLRGKKAYIYLDSPSLELRRFIEALNLKTFSDDYDHVLKMLEETEEYCLLLVDIHDYRRFSSSKIKNLVERSTIIFIIDHHYGQIPREKKIVAYRRFYPSSCEVALELLENEKEFAMLIKRKELANALIGAILFDTNFFLNAQPRTFYHISELVKNGDLKLVYQILKEKQRELPERIARLKGAQRLQLLKIGNTLITVSKIGSYESSVANALLSLGADISLVVSRKKENSKRYIRVVGRSRKKVNMAAIFSKLAKSLGGVGGGHERAAAIQIPVDRIQSEEELVKEIIKEILKILQNALS
ncbi:MAG: DHH family phosphoesterase [Candidatus Njordarchaeales archaeon]|mgnify:CR=1 FL=1